MADPVIEVLTGATASTAHSVPIATALVPSDLVICITSTYNSGTSAVTPSGLGTWSAELGGMATAILRYGFRVHTLTGVTGGGNITLSQTSPGSGYVVLVVRGLDTPVLDAFAVFLIEDGAATSATLEAAARANALAVSIGRFTSGTPTNPSSADPASGWTLDANATGSSGLSVAHNTITSAQRVQATISGAASTSDHGVGLFIFGTPLESRAQSAYAEAVIGGTGATPDRAVAGEYAEAILNDGAPGERALDGTYAEAIHGGTGVAGVAGEYAEAMHGIPPGAVAEARLRSEYAEAISQAPPGVSLAGDYAEVIATPIPPAADAAILSEYAEVIGVAIPPQAEADIAGAQLEVMHAAFTAEIGSVYVEAIKRYTPPGPGGGAAWGWGIHI
ncbi:hypothetical protein [Agromyces sp. NPDC058104]|uniref:hypothetical protein n=1 Tax=Agromyces sp. NPDC058104 TaxID=3346342 RepID=UPI0036DEAB4E